MRATRAVMLLAMVRRSSWFLCWSVTTTTPTTSKTDWRLATGPIRPDGCRKIHVAVKTAAMDRHKSLRTHEASSLRVVDHCLNIGTPHAHCLNISGAPIQAPNTHAHKHLNGIRTKFILPDNQTNAVPGQRMNDRPGPARNVIQFQIPVYLFKHL